MEETRLVCDRCDESGEWEEPPEKWARLELDHSFILMDDVDRLDLCPACAVDLEEWFLSARGDLSETEEMALKGLRKLD